jgi:hypothetical protein
MYLCWAFLVLYCPAMWSRLLPYLLLPPASYSQVMLKHLLEGVERAMNLQSGAASMLSARLSPNPMHFWECRLSRRIKRNLKH